MSNRLFLPRVYSVLILSCCIPSVFAADPPKNAAPANSNVLATIGTTAVTKDQVLEFAKSRGAPPNALDDPNIARSALIQYINQEVLVMEGAAQKVEQRKDVQRLIEQYRRTAIAATVMNDTMKANPIKAQDVKKVYDEQVGANRTEYRARHILVKTEAEAKAILAQLNKGADFAKLAADKSEDPGSAKNGGDLGWTPPERFVKPFADAMVALSKGKTTPQPVQSNFGWHIIRLDDTRPVSPPPLEQVKEEIENELRQQAANQHLERLRTKYKVEIK